MKIIKEIVDFNNLDITDEAIIDIEIRLSAISCIQLMEFSIDEIDDYTRSIATPGNLNLAISQRYIRSFLI